MKRLCALLLPSLTCCTFLQNAALQGEYERLPTADPVFDRELATKLVEAGAEVGAMTPGQLAGWLAEKLN